jgi:putative FmdB family regulatory protein
MPIYEYRCRSCKKVSSFLLLRTTEEVEPYCKACGSREVDRKVSRVAILKGEEKMMESLLDPSKLSDLDENDPASVERVMRRMGRELGDELGEDFQESMEEALSGEHPAAPQEDPL